MKHTKNWTLLHIAPVFAKHVLERVFVAFCGETRIRVLHTHLGNVNRVNADFFGNIAQLHQVFVQFVQIASGHTRLHDASVFLLLSIAVFGKRVVRSIVVEDFVKILHVLRVNLQRFDFFIAKSELMQVRLELSDVSARTYEHVHEGARLCFNLTT